MHDDMKPKTQAKRKKAVEGSEEHKKASKSRTGGAKHENKKERN